MHLTDVSFSRRPLVRHTPEPSGEEVVSLQRSTSPHAFRRPRRDYRMALQTQFQSVLLTTVMQHSLPLCRYDGASQACR